MPTEIVIVLGSPNGPHGELSDIALSRLNCCIAHYKDNMKILCTGGWGEHFNTSQQPHAFYSKQYLLSKDIPESAFLEFALSKHTVDDAVKAHEIISKLNPIGLGLTVITSDFHLKRVKLIFNTVFKKYAMHYIGAKSNLDQAQHKSLLAHEEKAVQSILKNGLYF